MPQYRPAPEGLPPPYHLPATGAARPADHRPMPADRPADCALRDRFPALGYLTVPDSTPAPDHRSAPGPPQTLSRAAPGSRPPSRKPAVADHLPISDYTIPEHLAVAARPVPNPDSGRQQMAAHPPAPGNAMSKYVPVAARPVAATPAPERPPMAAAHPPIPGNTVPEAPPVVGWPPVPDYPAVPPYLSVRDNPPVPDWPAACMWRPRAFLRRLARCVPRQRTAGGTAGRRAAITGYLTVPLFGVPLVIYLTALRGPGWARQHAANAVNVWFTGFLYDLSALIMGAMLALDTPQVALIVFAPPVAARWLVTLAYLVRAARAASRGEASAFPGWLCMRIAR
jgi:hypothetical protein